jgi:hypothetical protein
MLDSVTDAQVQEKGRDIAVVALHIEQKGGHVGIIPPPCRRDRTSHLLVYQSPGRATTQPAEC